MRSRVAVPLVLLALLAGCSADPAQPTPAGSTGQPPATSDLPDPCAILTKADVDDALGPARDAPPVPDSSETGERDCAYAVDSPAAVVSISVIAGGRTRFDQFEEASRRVMPTVEDVPDLGDDAFLISAILYVLKGQYVLRLTIGGIGTEVRDILLDLAPKALARL